jgi:hypothetical protein
MIKNAMRWAIPGLALLALAAAPALAETPAAQPAPVPPVAQVPSPDGTGCGVAVELGLAGGEATLTMTPAVPEPLDPLFLKPPPPFFTRTCVCSCGYPCTTDADCGPGGNCGPGITCC